MEVTQLLTDAACVLRCAVLVPCVPQVKGQLQQATWGDALRAVAAATADLKPNEFKAIAGGAHTLHTSR